MITPADIQRKIIPAHRIAESRFWSKVDISGDCWEWTGSRNSAGYGNFKVERHVVLAHRFAYMNVNGFIPPHVVLDHTCRNILCVRPDHLDPVTQTENMRRTNGFRSK